MFKKIVIFILGVGLLNTGFCQTPGKSVSESSTSPEKQVDTKEHKFDGDSALTEIPPPLAEVTEETTPTKATEKQQAGNKEKEEKPVGQTKANEPNKP